MDGLTGGSMVHYVTSDGAHRPAIVIVARKDGVANLLVIYDGYHDYKPAYSPIEWMVEVPYKEEGERESWHWIEPA